MRFVESVRIGLERSDFLRDIYDSVGRFPPYRRLVNSRVKKRIAEVEESRGYSLMIETSSVCNAKCTFCASLTMERKKGIMTDETFEAILSRVKSDGINPRWIDLFSTGEPLLDRSLFSRVRKLKAVFPRSRIRITTNFATATDSAIEEILSCGLDSVFISLNASRPETYARIMGLKYERTVQNVNRLLELRKARGSSLKVLLSMVMCPENAGEEAAFVRMWKNKVDSIRLQRVVDYGKFDVRSAYRARAALYPCSELFERIPILSNGDAALCCHDPEGIIGLNVRDHSLLDIFHSSRFKRFRDMHLRGEIAQLPMCRNCFGVHSNGAQWLFQNFE